MSNHVGFRAYTNLKRPPAKLIEAFRDIPSSNIADQMGRLYNSGSALKALNRRPLLGPAFTVKLPQGDNLMLHYAMEIAKPGDILVVDGEGDLEHSLMGEMMATYCQKRGIGGLVIGGCVRDIDALEKMEIPIYAMGVTPQGPYKNGPGEINVPVSIAGLVVMPGDIIAGDADGIVAIRPADAEEIAQAARKKFDAESAALEKGSFNKKWVLETIEKSDVQIITQ